MPGTYARDYIPQVTLILDASGVPSFPEPHRRAWFVSDGEGADHPDRLFRCDDEDGTDWRLDAWRWWSAFARVTGLASDRAMATFYRLAYLGGDS